VLLVGYEIARRVVFGGHRQLDVRPWMLAALAIAAALPLAFSYFEARAARRGNSPALRADAREYRVHALTTGAAMGSLLLADTGWPVDRIAAGVILVPIVKTAWDLLADSMRVLLDASLPPETLERVGQILAEEPTVATVRRVQGRNAGRFRFIEASVTLRVRELAKADEVTHRLGRRIREQMPHVERVVIHADPERKNNVLVAIPLGEDGESICPCLAEAGSFMLWRCPRGRPEDAEDRRIAPPDLRREAEPEVALAEWLVAEGVDRLVVRDRLDHKGPWYVFHDAGVEIRQTDADRLGQVIDACRDELCRSDQAEAEAETEAET
jgi:hypothetical protein